MSLVETYLIWIKKLSVDARLELIARISDSIRKEAADRSTQFFSTCGKLETDGTADELVDEIRSARYFRDKSIEL